MARPVIVPAILTENPEELKAQMAKYAAFAKRVQVDISDGSMASDKTVSETAIVIPPGVSVDVHMMSSDPAGHMDALVKLKPSMVILHAEAQGDLLPLFAQLKQAGIKAGVAFQKQTYPGAMKPYIDAVDHVMIFAGELGKQGSIADMLQTEKARIVRGMRADVEIGWDGGATMRNVRTIFQGGVVVINVGNALKAAADPVAEYNALLAEAEKPGVM